MLQILDSSEDHRLQLAPSTTVKVFYSVPTAFKGGHFLLRQQTVVALEIDMCSCGTLKLVSGMLVKYFSPHLAVARVSMKPFLT